MTRVIGKREIPGLIHGIDVIGTMEAARIRVREYLADQTRG